MGIWKPFSVHGLRTACHLPLLPKAQPLAEILMKLIQIHHYAVPASLVPCKGFVYSPLAQLNELLSRRLEQR